jgi:ParB-like nuclease family protein
MTVNITESNPIFHPLANAFPLLDEDSEEFAELVKDIEEHGLNSPIVRYEGKILDGRNRWRALQKINDGLPVNERLAGREVQFDADRDPVAFVWSANAVRRQLTPAQRAMAAEQLATASRGYQRKNGDGSDTDAEMTIPEAAEKTGASVSSIERARRVRKTAAPEVVAAVEKGDLQLGTAERLAEKPVEEQKEIMATTPVADLPKVVPPARTRKARKDADEATEGAHEAPEGIGTAPETVDEPGVTVPDIAPVPEKTDKGRRRSPETIMREQLIKFYLVPAMVPLEFWTEHADSIAKLPKSQLEPYVKDLKATRTEITRLLKLIDEHTKK